MLSPLRKIQDQVSTEQLDLENYKKRHQINFMQIYVKHQDYFAAWIYFLACSAGSICHNYVSVLVSEGELREGYRYWYRT